MRASPLFISRLSLQKCRLATLMALFVSYLFLSPSVVTLSDILYLKHPRGGATTLSIILHFSTGRICYQYPNKSSSVPIKTNCSFPENLCFKFDYKTEDNEQVTIQGCITAEQCRQSDDEHFQCCEGDLCNNSKCHGYRKLKFINLGARFDNVPNQRQIIKRKKKNSVRVRTIFAFRSVFSSHHHDSKTLNQLVFIMLLFHNL